jgi:hypothetical protein
MAISTVVFNKFKLRQANLSGAVDLDADTIKVLLVTSAYTPNIDTHEFASDITNELALTGNYVRKTLGSVAVAIDTAGDFVYLDAADVVWTALTPSAPFRKAIVYKDTGSDATSPLMFYIDFGEDQPAGSDFTITWQTPANGGVLRLM